MEVLIEEFFITESWKGIDVKKSLHQSRVHVKNADGKWVEYGLIGHQSCTITGLCGSPNELGNSLAEACTEYLTTKGPKALRGKSITFGGSPILDVEDDEIDALETEESDE